MKKMLVLLLTLCLLAGMVPLGAGAIEPATDGVYEVDSFDDLSAAISVAENGVATTIRLTAGFTVANEINIPSGTNIVLDLNGQKIESTVDGYTLVNNGTLTINDETNNGIVCNTSTAAATNKTHFILRNYGTMTINGGTFGDTDTDRANDNTANWGAAIINLAGTCTINGGYFTCGDNYWSAEPAGANYSYAIRNSDQTATMLFKGGTVYGKMNGGIAADSGVITIEDTTVSVTGEKSYGCLSASAGKGNFVVKGGSFTKSGNNHPIINNFEGMPSWDASDDLLANGYDISGGVFIVNDEEVDMIQSAVAQVGEKKYSTLARAIQDASSGDTVTLQRDASTEPITINKGITLDLGGTTLTLKKVDSTSASGLNFSNNGDNVLKNGVICDERSKGTTSAGFISVRLTGGGTLTTENVEIQNYQPDSAANYNYILRADGETGTLNLKSGTKLTELKRTTQKNETYGTVGVALLGTAETQDTTLSHTIDLVIEDGVSINTMGFAISGNGSNSNGTNITINGGEIVSKSAQAIYHPQYGTLTIKGGKITGDTGIEMRSGILNVSDSAIITGTGTPFSVGPNGNGSTTAGVGIAVAQHTTKLPIKVNISGGTISGYTGFYESNPQNNTPDDLARIELSISGGQFSSINGGVNSIYSEDCSKFISSGYFTSDPSDYVATGYYAGESDNPAYAYQVKENENKGSQPAEVVAAEPAVKASGITDEDDAEKVAAALAGTEATLDAAAQEQAAKNTVDTPAATTALTTAGIATGGKTVTVVVQPYLAMEAKSYDGTNSTMTVDIKAMYRTVATTADLDKDEIIYVQGDVGVGGTGNKANAVVIDNKEGTVLPVKGSVEISIPLPDGFATAATKTIFVQHKGYEYEAAVTSDGKTPPTYTATFTNPHGFSTFVLSTKSETVATVKGTNYTNFQQAVNAAGPSDTITVKQNNLAATDVTHDLILKNSDPRNSITVTINGKTIMIPAGGTETFTYTAPTPPRPTEEKHSITISTNGKGQVTGPASAAEDDKVTLTVKPNADKELYDLKVTDEDGKAIAVTKVNDTTYTFTMPDGKVTVAATFGCDGGDNCPSKAFTDLGDKQWYHDSIDYAVENGLLEGTSPTTMEPNATLIRAQLAQILYNIEDKPAVTGEMVFEDVPASEWFYSPVLWANQNEIINGTSPITFEPLENISRQDLALMLYRYAGEPKVTGDLDGFTDADQVGDWAEEAMAWAVAEGIVQGDTPTTLNPTGTATRAEAAAMLQRFLENAA